MKRLLSCSIAVFICILGSSARAQNLVLYDDFKAGYIDPAKWNVWWICGNGAYDCAREVQKKKLRLAIRAYGAT